MLLHAPSPLHQTMLHAHCMPGACRLLQLWHAPHSPGCMQIENRQGLESFADILAVADAILLSRGNLGLDVAAEKMAMVQKVPPDAKTWFPTHVLEHSILGVTIRWLCTLLNLSRFWRFMDSQLLVHAAWPDLHCRACYLSMMQCAGHCG